MSEAAAIGDVQKPNTIAGEVAALCPECGADAGLRSRPRWSRAVRLARALRWLVIVGVVGVIVVQNWRQTRVAFLGGPTAQGSVLRDVILPGFTVSDMRAIASGEADGEGLKEALRTHTPRYYGDEPGWLAGLNHIRIGLATRDGDVTETTGIGWPAELMTITKQTNYEDALARKGPVAKDWGVEKRTGRGLTRTPSGVATMTSVRRFVNWSHVQLAAVLAIAAAWILVMAARVIACRRARRRGVNHARRGAGRAWLWASAVVLLAMGTLTVMSVRHHTSVDPGGTIQSWQFRDVEAGCTVSEARSGEVDIRGLARAVVKLADANGAPEDAVVAASFMPGYIYGYHTASIRWPWPLMFFAEGYIRPTIPGAMTQVPQRELSVRLGHLDWGAADPAVAWYSRGSEPGQVNAWHATLYSGNIARIAFPLVAFWIISGVCLRLLDGRVARRRLRTNCCVACGYSLAGLNRCPGPAGC